MAKMLGVYCLSLILLLVYGVHGLFLQNDATIMPSFFDTQHPSSGIDECDPSTVPVMPSFDMKKFSGAWFELSKSASGYIDVNDGMWKIQTTNTSNTFLFSGRDSNAHCIRPIKGKIHVSDEPPGTLHLQYKTYSNHVSETIRVLFTDYTSIAVIYKCVFYQRKFCHSAGFVGAIWTRQPHVELHVFETGVRYLEMVCVHKSSLIIRNQIGPCRMDDTGFQIDDFPVPDFCYQPMDLGFCNGNIQRYHYNPKSKSCETFTYHGCGGNENNFMTLPECQEKCLSVSHKQSVCLSSAICAIHCAPCCTEDRSGCIECNCEKVVEDDVLNCMKSPASCQPECAVEEFYPGCYICSCPEETEPVGNNETPECLEVKAAGNCQEQVERYYYNAITEECEKFIYSGCNGNKNNFETMEQCNEKCIGGTILKADVVKENNSAAEITHIWIARSLLLLLSIMFSHNIL